jgi:hypothetical protein
MPEESKTRIYIKSFVLGGLVVVAAAVVWLIMAERKLNEAVRNAQPAAASQSTN